MARKAFLNNSDMIEEIFLSKASYCSAVDDKYVRYDHIVEKVSDITPELVQIIRAKKARPRGGIKVTTEEIDPEGVVFRVMTYEHIPLDPDRVRKSRVTVESYAYTPFPPFKHYILQNNYPIEVLRSNWVGGLQNGHFANEGKMTNNLAKMFMKFVDKLGTRGNYRGYSYLEEMKGQALIQLCYVGLQFNEARSNNPFAYYTTIVNNSFVRILNQEKKSQEFRDDLIQDAGGNPSWTRQTKLADERMFGSK